MAITINALKTRTRTKHELISLLIALSLLGLRLPYLTGFILGMINGLGVVLAEIIATFCC